MSLGVSLGTTGVSIGTTGVSLMSTTLNLPASGVVLLSIQVSLVGAAATALPPASGTGKFDFSKPANSGLIVLFGGYP